MTNQANTPERFSVRPFNFDQTPKWQVYDRVLGLGVTTPDADRDFVQRDCEYHNARWREELSQR